MSAHPRLKSQLRRVKALSRWNAAAGSGRWPLPERRRPYQITAAGQEILAGQVTAMQQIVQVARLRTATAWGAP